MPPVVKEVSLVTAAETTSAPTDIVSQIVALAANPDMDVAKLEKLIDLQERVMKRTAEEHFNAAMADAQTDIRPVAADALNKQTGSRYATYAALDNKLRPIYSKHGFGLSFDMGDGARDGWIRVLCHVTHRAGGARTYHADLPADGKGAKGGDVMTQTHAVGAGMSYGMRYLLKMIFNVAIGEDDRDGNDLVDAPIADPAGYDDWRMDLELTAQEKGLAALTVQWKASSEAFRQHTFKHYRTAWEVTKQTAAKVKGV